MCNTQIVRLNNIIYKNQVDPMIYQKNASRVISTGWQNFYHAMLIKISCNYLAAYYPASGYVG